MIWSATSGSRSTRLIVATGATHHYFGHRNGSSTPRGSRRSRTRPRSAAGSSRRSSRPSGHPDGPDRRALLTFVVVGGGPTGVEMAGAIGELAHHTLRNDFRPSTRRRARIILVEGGDRVLPAFPEKLSARRPRRPSSDWASRSGRRQGHGHPAGPRAGRKRRRQGAPDRHGDGGLGGRGEGVAAGQDARRGDRRRRRTAAAGSSSSPD